MNNPHPWWLTMPVAELAATILPLFSYFTHQSWEGAALKTIVGWCRTGSYQELPLGSPGESPTAWLKDPDCRAVAEAVQVLEHAGLLIRIVNYAQAGSMLGLTRLGEHALATHTVRQHLGLSDAAPTEL